MPDNGAWVAKQALRVAVAAVRAGPVLECFAGEGRMWRACYTDRRGLTNDKDPLKARSAARERLTWGVYSGDTERMLRAGWGAETPFGIFDVDAYGEPWPFVRAWYDSARVRAPVTELVLTDGYMTQASLSPLSRTLFGGRARERHASREVEQRAHRMVDAALKDGRIRADEPCEACGAPQGVGTDNLPLVVRHHWSYSHPLDTIPLCLECHQQVHRGTIPEPRTGRVYNRAERMDVPPALYMETVHARLAEWDKLAGTRTEFVETIRDTPKNGSGRPMHLHWLRAHLVSGNAPLRAKPGAVLAIDDDSRRYDELRRLRPGLDIRAASCPACVAALLPTAGAVMLDFDLDLKPCPRCGRDGAPVTGSGLTVGPNPHGKGSDHVEAVVARGVPVVVTSANDEGAAELGRLLGAHTHVIAPARFSGASLRWAEALDRFGVQPRPNRSAP